jgi:hypothetical protein
MRQRAGALNRTWLTILGILALAGGIALLLQAAGALQGLLGTPPVGDKVVLPGGLDSFFAQSWGAVLLLIIGVIIGVLGFLWLIAQVPRKNPADAYRLHGNGAQGRTLCDPSVLASAVEDQIDTLPGVVTSSALLRGTADEPDLTLKVTVNDRADIRDLLHRLENSVLPDIVTSLEAPLQQCRLQIDVTRRTQSTGAVAHSTGIILQ